VRQVCVETSDYGFTNPETSLMAFLYSYLPTRKAIDVGAHAGDVSEALLKAGYEVYAFEPYPPVYAKLVKRLGNDTRFHPFPYALGCIEGEMQLHAPAQGALQSRAMGRHHGAQQLNTSLHAGRPSVFRDGHGDGEKHGRFAQGKGNPKRHQPGQN
jgi:hypothetical protein